jgi:hypothetical protein
MNMKKYYNTPFELQTFLGNTTNSKAMQYPLKENLPIHYTYNPLAISSSS